MRQARIFLSVILFLPLFSCSHLQTSGECSIDPIKGLSYGEFQQDFYTVTRPASVAEIQGDWILAAEFWKSENRDRRFINDGSFKPEHLWKIQVFRTHGQSYGQSGGQSSVVLYTSAQNRGAISRGPASVVVGDRANGGTISALQHQDGTEDHHAIRVSKDGALLVVWDREAYIGTSVTGRPESSDIEVYRRASCGN